MAVNLLEEDQLVYHDINTDTFEVRAPTIEDLKNDSLDFFGITGFGNSVDSTRVRIDRDAVQTLRDALTCWLETGKLK